MKVIHHKNTNAANEAHDAISQAKKLEERGELDKAASAYEKITTRDPLNEFAYNRLMIIYRKNKDYKKELDIIKKAITNFQQSFKTSSRITVTKRIATLSKSLLKSLGLIDRKGNVIAEREPLGRWLKRKLVVERLVKKKKS